jgi:hypothetical protein
MGCKRFASDSLTLGAASAIDLFKPEKLDVVAVIDGRQERSPSA